MNNSESIYIYVTETTIEMYDNGFSTLNDLFRDKLFHLGF